MGANIMDLAKGNEANAVISSPLWYNHKALIIRVLDKKGAFEALKSK